LNDDRRDDVRGHNAWRQAEQRVQAHEQQQENRDEYTDQEQRERPKVRCDDQVLGKVSLLPDQERVKQQRNDRYQGKYQCLGQDRRFLVVFPFQRRVLQLESKCVNVSTASAR